MNAIEPSPSRGPRTASHVLIETLVDLGIEYIFANMGTDHAPLIEALAEMRSNDKKLPEVILCAHENTAIHMAGGYAQATGRGQAVFVHVDVGTANIATGLHNLFRSRLPVLVIAGRAPFTTHGELPGTRDNYVHFIQEPFDQASLVRPYVKWDYALPSAHTVEEVLRRAHDIMHWGNPGPVYLSVARETLAASAPETSFSARITSSRGGPVTLPDQSDIDALAGRMVRAQNPLVITSYAGRTRRGSDALARLANAAGARIIETASVCNIDHSMPGFSGMMAAPYLAQADVGLVVDSDVPWIPALASPGPDAYWAHIDRDVTKSASPLWTFPTQMRLEGESGAFIERLCDRIEALSNPDHRRSVQARLAQIGREREVMKGKAEAMAQDPGGPVALNVHHVLRALGRQVRDGDVIVNEAVRNQGAVLMQVPQHVPSRTVRSAGGGLGAAAGLALGYSLARRDDIAIAIMGDGAFYANAPLSYLAVAAQYDLPVLSVVLDNGGWSAVKESTLAMYDAAWARATNDFASRLYGGADFAQVANAMGCAGYCLENPEAIEETFAKAIGVVRDGRSALVHVKLSSH